MSDLSRILVTFSEFRDYFKSWYLGHCHTWCKKYLCCRMGKGSYWNGMRHIATYNRSRILLNDVVTNARISSRILDNMTKHAALQISWGHDHRTFTFKFVEQLIRPMWLVWLVSNMVILAVWTQQFCWIISPTYRMSHLSWKNSGTVTQLYTRPQSMWSNMAFLHICNGTFLQSVIQMQHL